MSDETTPPTSPATEPTAPAPDNFAAKLKGARAAAGLSQKKTGELCKVSLTTVFKWEHGQSEPSPQKQAAVLRKLRELVAVKVAPLPDDFRGTPTELTEAIADRMEIGAPGINAESDEFARNAIEQANQERASMAATPEELAHDPHEPVTDLPELSPDAIQTSVPLTPVTESLPDTPVSSGPMTNLMAGAIALSTPLPDTPVGNVHTSQDGVVRRRLADDDEREGAELIDGRKWFTVGFAPPHPRAKAAVKPISVEQPAATPAPVQATQKAPVAPTHTETTPKAPEPVESAPEPAAASPGRRDWGWWSQ